MRSSMAAGCAFSAASWHSVFSSLDSLASLSKDVTSAHKVNRTQLRRVNNHRGRLTLGKVGARDTFVCVGVVGGVSGALPDGAPGLLGISGLATVAFG